MRQAIHTKFIAPTNTRGSRVKAQADAGSITISWNHALGVEGNHAAAAKALASKLGWDSRWFGGGMRNSGYCFVQSDDGVPDFV